MYVRKLNETTSHDGAENQHSLPLTHQAPRIVKLWDQICDGDYLFGHEYYRHNSSSELYLEQ